MSMVDSLTSLVAAFADPADKVSPGQKYMTKSIPEDDEAEPMGKGRFNSR